MLNALMIATTMVVAVAMALSLAHALELPGKMRLGRDAYYATQRIYYPGFTFGGIAEPVGSALTLVVLLLTPRGTADFWLLLVALLALAAMQAVYWRYTHPVNRSWLQGEKLGAAGASFFSAGSGRTSRPSDARPAAWTALRNRWEYSHVARAAFGLVALLALVVAVSSVRSCR